MINNILVIILFLSITIIYFKDNLSMMYFIPFFGLLLIYLNTNKYEHFLCELENKVNDMFLPDQFFGKLIKRINDTYSEYGPDTIIKKVRNDTRSNLLKINKSAENIILKI